MRNLVPHTKFLIEPEEEHLVIAQFSNSYVDEKELDTVHKSPNGRQLEVGKLNIEQGNNIHLSASLPIYPEPRSDHCNKDSAPGRGPVCGAPLNVRSEGRSEHWVL